jgi:unsaturated rhamnogalacturonyl hydrolase
MRTMTQDRQTDESDAARVGKVKLALLCFQRFQWEQGCAAQALLEYDGYSGAVAALCESALVRSATDGRPGVMEKNESVDDPAAIGEALLATAARTGSERYAKAAERLYFYLKHRAPRTIDGIIYHFNLKHEVWVDAYYMAPPFLCKYGDIDEAMRQIRGFRKYLFDEDRQLLSHIWDDDAGKFGRKDFWGVGNGWAVAGLTRVIGMLPPERPAEKAYLIGYLTLLLDAMIALQRPDGLFHNVLDDPSSFVETNAGQMAAYAIYRGIRAGYLDASYRAAADLARTAAHAKVDELGFVREVCGAPGFDAPGIAPEGQAFFILMEAAHRDLLERADR